MLVVAATRAEAEYVPARFPLLVTGIGTVGWLLRWRPVSPGPDGHLGTAGRLRDGATGLHLPSMVLKHDISAEILAQMGYPVVAELEVPGGVGSVLASGSTFVTGVRAELASPAAKHSARRHLGPALARHRRSRGLAVPGFDDLPVAAPGGPAQVFRSEPVLRQSA